MTTVPTLMETTDRLRCGTAPGTVPVLPRGWLLLKQQMLAPTPERPYPVAMSG